MAGDKMRYRFAKIHGLGNDFVLMDDMAAAIDFDERTIAAICDRHFGVGADGLILARPATDGVSDAFMCYYNSDGTVAQMCGNGVRCFAKFLVDRGIVAPDGGILNIQTLAGVKRIGVTLDDNGKVSLARVEMGAPILEPSKVPTTLPATAGGAAVNAPMQSPLGQIEVTCVSMGNPHCVTFMDDRAFFDDPASFAIEQIGPAMETSEVFPEKCNIEFAHIVDPGSDEKGRPAEILMRVWERGCGETLACGTGACATTVAAHLAKNVASSATVHLRGGDLHIELDEGGVVMTGPAQESFTGEIEI